MELNIISRDRVYIGKEDAEVFEVVNRNHRESIQRKRIERMVEENYQPEEDTAPATRISGLYFMSLLALLATAVVMWIR